MGKAEDDKQPIVSALRLFGAIRIWGSVIVGLVVVVGCVVAFVLSYTWEAGYIETIADVTQVDCGSVQKLTECKQSGSNNTCITTESVTCEVTVLYDGDRTASFRLQYDEGYEPSIGDRFPMFFDRDHPERVAQTKLTEGQRTTVRIVCGIVGVIATVVVVINILFLNNSSFRLLQGGLGTIGATRGIF